MARRWKGNMTDGQPRSPHVSAFPRPNNASLDRVVALVKLASFRDWSFGAFSDAGLLRLHIARGGVIERRESWSIPDDAGYDEAQDVTLRAVLELAGEEGRPEYSYRGEPAPGK